MDPSAYPPEAVHPFVLLSIVDCLEQKEPGNMSRVITPLMRVRLPFCIPEWDASWKGSSWKTCDSQGQSKVHPGPKRGAMRLTHAYQEMQQETPSPSQAHCGTPERSAMHVQFRDMK